MPSDTIITPTDNGPLHVRGSFTIVLPSGRELATDGEAWLCRCGASRNKPFCDGSHAAIGFSAVEAQPTPLTATPAAVAEDGFEPVGAADAVGEGELLGVEVAGRPVVVGRVGGRLYAIGGICSHAQARLEGGSLEDGLVICPLHGGGFDIRTGEPARLPVRQAVPHYALKVEGGQILVSRHPSAALQEAV